MVQRIDYPVMKIGILDYGVGNIASISNAIKRLGYECTIVGAGHKKPKLTHLIIPGVGSFGYCRNKLNNPELSDLLLEYVSIKKINTLGICVGMQLMFESSTESPDYEGLSWFDGTITKLLATNNQRVPHVGWNEVNFIVSTVGFECGDKPNFYFDHSFAYKGIETDYTVATCEYSEKFTAIVERDHMIGIQFHPEKSQKNGLRILKSFITR